MGPDWTPLRWPGEWRRPSALELVRNSPVNCLLVEGDSPLISEMKKLGVTILDTSAAPPGINVLKGVWPGVRMGRNGDASAGPTGAPWVDSNGWQVRLARVREPDKPVWVTAGLPRQSILSPVSFLIAIADAAVYGGRWLLELDPNLRRTLADRDAPALETWNRMMAALRFFAAQPAWSRYRPIAAVAIVSDFSGGNEFLSGELLNLTARLHQPYLILEKSKLPPLDGLRAVIYPDADPPPSGVRRKLLAFVQAGGLLLVGEKFGAEGAPSAEAHPRYTIRALGKGRIASGQLQDPYLAASDAQILLSHRHDVLRFWNGGALGSYLTHPPDGRGALLHIVNYAGRPGADPVSARVSGPYREARIRRLEDQAWKPLDSVAQKDAIELHLPDINVYAAIELG